MEEHNTRFELKSRYFTLGKLGAKTESVWFVIHGYGQLAKYFLKKFEPLSESHFIIAPEGLSKFYQEGFSGRVVATWMTKENRLTEIENYINYLNSIYVDLGLENYSINVLGFSQGVATASRWVLNQDKVKIKQLVLWSGQFPPDIDINSASQRLSAIKTQVVYGTQDPYITPDGIKSQVQFLEELGSKPIISTFSGAHDMDINHFLEVI